MTKLIFISMIFFSFSAFSFELKINRWYKLNDANGDTAAEVCFSLNPAPEKPTFAEITVDPRTRLAANYTTWIGPKGSVCHIVSTFRGRVEVEIPEFNLSSKLNSNLK